MAKYIEFLKYPKKTQVLNVKSGALLGAIYFYKPWKKIIFEPRPNTVFDSKCLQHIIARMAMEPQE